LSASEKLCRAANVLVLLQQGFLAMDPHRRFLIETCVCSRIRW